MIGLSRAFVGEEELAEIKRVFAEGAYFGMGKEVGDFEKKIAEFLQAKVEVVCVNTGTSALHIALEALEFPKGSEVIVPSLTFAASYAAIKMAGLTPVSCDVVYPSGHLDPNDVERRITDKTVAIMPIAYSGCDFDRKAIYDLAEARGLRVIEDDAHAFGSIASDGKMFGATGDIVCFSFDGIKNITCGEGGAVVTSNPELAHKIKVLRGLGIEADVHLRYKGQRAWNYNISKLGFRYHMPNMSAAMGKAQLLRMPFFKTKKRDLWNEYTNAIQELNLQDVLTVTQNFDPNVILHIFPVLLPKNIERSVVSEQLKAKGIETGFHYAPNHLHDLFKSNYSLPIVEEMAGRLLSLPFHAGMQVTDVKVVLLALKEIFEANGIMQMPVLTKANASVIANEAKQSF